MKIDLLKRKKTTHDLLLGLEKIFISKRPDKNDRWRRYGVGTLAALLHLENKTLIKYLNYGLPMSTRGTFENRIKALCKDFDIPLFKRVSARYDRNTFTVESFVRIFSNVRNTRLKKEERLLGRGGLYMKFNRGYIIPLFPFAEYDNKEMKRLILKMGQNIKQTIKRFDSMIFFDIVFLTANKVTLKKL